MDLSAPHRVPLTWLLYHGSESIRLRTVEDLAPANFAELDPLVAQAADSAMVTAITAGQSADGSWGENLLGIKPSVRDGVRDVGTVAQYRRLLQLGVPTSARAFKLADRMLFRVLSRDEDPALLFEYRKLARETPARAEWLRNLLREGATAALAEAGHGEDPRIRGSAHRIASAVSAFLRSPLSDNPFSRSGRTTILNPEAHPPTWWSVAMIAAMPNLQRERAGFTERLGQYLSQHASKRAYAVPVGKRAIKPWHILLGDPVECDAKGNCKDLPLALHFFELLARLGALPHSQSANRVLGRLYAECDEYGVWRPRKLGTGPKAVHPMSYHTYPLQAEPRAGEGRVADVTFRLAQLARLAGRPLEFT